MPLLSYMENGHFSLHPEPKMRDLNSDETGMDRYIFLFVLLLTLLPELSAAQNLGMPYCGGDDTLDPYPAWACRDLRNEVVSHLRWEGWGMLDADAREMLLSGEAIVYIDPCIVSYAPSRTTNEALRLLAWRSIRRHWSPAAPHDGERDGDTLSGDVTHHQALVAVRFTDDAFRRRWIVMEISLTEDGGGGRRWCAPDNTGVLGRNRTLRHIGEITGYMPRAVQGIGRIGYRFKLATSAAERPLVSGASAGTPAAVHGRDDDSGRVALEQTKPITREPADSSLIAIAKIYREFDTRRNACYGDGDASLYIRAINRPPTNADIYSFLTDLSAYRGEAGDAIGFFDPQWFIDPAHEEFIGGDVRANAWREVTGEDPVLFFPGGASP